MLTSKDVAESVKEVIDALGLSVTRGRRVEIRGFGSFSLNYRPPRIGRNPKSGVPVNVRGKWVPHFKAGKEMRERIDSPPQHMNVK